MVNRRIWLTPLFFICSLLPFAQANAMVTQGVASYYGERFNGRQTASGERFNMNALTAAHRTLEFGTRVMVTNTSNGRSVEVVINDRGPYIRGRTIDLSKGAARELGMLGRGVAKVRLEIMGGGRAPSSTGSGLTVADAQQMMMDLF
ncbi:septal ring lytic transglycosylase RlpA family protein [Imhoffiella purpurea]|uniref:Endolytic peptidoglycan transglycosylase RlpA n=1 Tax=Imhoffiella purpurea TaxID=1249627 RepID=W9VHP9_9GAMM|nr:septal ring lytic transglycosylase RlpA family protein [Imhoffiella purpurea]EXJ16526.1 Rare lipoprotein A [Imhoffiella purpurea]